MSKRTLSDYLIEVNHLDEAINKCFQKGIIRGEDKDKYLDLIYDMNQKIEILWSYCIDLRNSIKKCEDSVAKDNVVLEAIKYTSEYLKKGTNWEYFND